MPPYQLYIAAEVIQQMDALPKRVRQQLLSHMLAICRAPGSMSDCTEHDHIGRLIDITLYRNFAIKYWVDNADHQIKVFDLVPADI